MTSGVEFYYKLVKKIVFPVPLMMLAMLVAPASYCEPGLTGTVHCFLLLMTTYTILGWTAALVQSRCLYNYKTTCGRGNHMFFFNMRILFFNVISGKRLVHLHTVTPPPTGSVSGSIC